MVAARWGEGLLSLEKKQEYEEKGNFAGFKNHAGLYPGPEAVLEFSEHLAEYRTSKGTIQLPYSRPVPAELVSDIARWCFETGNHP